MSNNIYSGYGDHVFDDAKAKYWYSTISYYVVYMIYKYGVSLAFALKYQPHCDI